MAMSRSGRIITLLVIDTLFFFLEIIVGYAVHSLALVADSFHMLNDVFSLLVALWAIKLSKQKSTSSYTYGWQRAEVLGALINGVFLLALCLSIFLEAIQRFFEPQTISNPILILVVGSCGLASNFVGLALFHDHGHAHPTPSGEANGHGAATPDVEVGHTEREHVHTHTHGPAIEETPILDEDGPIEEILPETVVARTMSAGNSPRPTKLRRSTPPPTRSTAIPTSPFTLAKMSNEAQAQQHGYSRSYSHSYGPGAPHHSRSESRQRTFASPVTNIHVFPAQNRQEIINAAARSDSEDEAALSSSSSEAEAPASEQTPLLAPDQSDSYGDATTSDTTLGAASGSHKRARSHSHSHSTHHHSKPKPKAAPQQNLNMRGVFLHVMGDALGNIGVISTALFIWKTDYWWRWYFDPAVSLFITAIIFASALPLVKSASKILLQAVPKGISLEEVKADILSIKGVESVHELHIWQLSDVKMIASLHIQIAFDPEEDDVVDSVSGVKRPSGQRYMKLARAIRTCLHAYGIHSSTIQPEYTPKENGGASGAGGNGGSNSNGTNGAGNGSSVGRSAGGRTYAVILKTGGEESGNGVGGSGECAGTGGCTDGSREEGGAGGAADMQEFSEASTETECLLECGEECGGGKCCGPMVVSEGHGHAH